MVSNINIDPVQAAVTAANMINLNNIIITHHHRQLCQHWHFHHKCISSIPSLSSQCGCPFMARVHFHYDWYICYWYPFVHCRPHSSSSRGRQVCEPQIHKYYSSTKKSNKQIHKNTQKPLKIQFQVFLYLTSRDVIGRRALPAWDKHPTTNRSIFILTVE